MREHSTMTIESDSDYDRAAGRLCLAIAELWEQHPEAWTQHQGASDARGCPVSAESLYACAWCSIGAAIRFAGELYPHFTPEDRMTVRDLAIERVLMLENRRLAKTYTGIHQWNDHACTSAADAAAGWRRAAVALLASARRQDAESTRRMRASIRHEEERELDAFDAL